jgi:large subunit ribosomal protein L31
LACHSQPGLPPGPVGGILNSFNKLDEVETMKDGVHPEYYETQVSCGCGNKFVTRSTRKELKVDICNVCHPFYTGKLKFVDTAGRIEKFKNKFAAAGYASLKRGKK